MITTFQVSDWSRVISTETTSMGDKPYGDGVR